MSRKLDNDRANFAQFALSGFGNSAKPGNQDGARDESEQSAEHTTGFWQQKAYTIALPIIIEQVSVDGDKHEFKIYVNPDADLSLSAYNTRSKKSSKQVFTIASQKVKAGPAIHMVFRVSAFGQSSLSHTAQHSLQQAIAHIYS